MDPSANRLLDQVRDQIKALLKDGKKVAAVRYYHEVSLAPLLEAKSYVEGVESGKSRLERMRPSLPFYRSWKGKIWRGLRLAFASIDC